MQTLLVDYPRVVFTPITKILLIYTARKMEICLVTEENNRVMRYSFKKRAARSSTLCLRLKCFVRETSHLPAAMDAIPTPLRPPLASQCPIETREGVLPHPVHVTVQVLWQVDCILRFKLCAPREIKEQNKRRQCLMSCARRMLSSESR
jgi:hypothetical protein